MVAPITGPFTTEESDPLRKSYVRRQRYRQRKPYDLRLAYNFVSRRNVLYKNFPSIHNPWPNNTESMVGGGTGSTFSAHHPLSLDITDKGEQGETMAKLQNQAKTRAWDKYNTALGESAEWLVNIAQRKEAFNMVASRTMQMLRFVNAVRRGRFGSAAKALSLDPNQPEVRKAARNARAIMRGRKTNRSMRVTPTWEQSKSFGRRLGGAVLEYSFGWAPLLGDIYSTCEFLSGGVPPLKVYGRGTVHSKTVISHTGWKMTAKTVRTDIMRCQLIADVHVTDPNLFLLSRMGLTNPAIVVYDLVPWSFVANWFFNIETMLRAYSPQFGWSHTNVATTYTLRSATESTGLSSLGEVALAANVAVSVTRQRTFEKPRLGLRAWSLSPARALNAISLLLQKLK